MLRKLALKAIVGLSSVFLLVQEPRAAEWPNIAGEGPQWPNLLDKATRLPDVEITGSTPAPRRAPPTRRYVVEEPIPAFTGELGMRYWFSWSKNAKDLYNIAGTALNSRLSWGDMNGHNVEVFGRLDHNNGFYSKTILGGGWLSNGHLIDEDFPPGISPYSSTTSDQSGTMAYGNIDIGYNFLRTNAVRIGAFAGYHFLAEQMSAFGCVQNATNTNICGGQGISTSVEVINQRNTWHALRLGFDADFKFTQQLTLHADAAWIPVVGMVGTDRHILRIGTTPGSFTGGIPEDGTGWGYQVELALSYAVNEYAKFGIGGRYWHMETIGLAHFENNVVGFNTTSQRLDWRTDHFGVFVQGSFAFGPYPTGSW